MLKIHSKLKGLLSLSLIASALLFNSCDKDDDASSAVTLKSFGPIALRGQTISFIGTNLNKVTAIVFPDGIEVNSFETKTASLIKVAIPDAAVKGFVILRTPAGDIYTKTELAIFEPITVSSFGPNPVKPGSTLTFQGTYLNLIKQVIFANNKIVTQFESQTRETLVVTVPMDAQTGVIKLSNGATVPLILESVTPLVVTLPVITSISPSPVKSGSNVTITGTDLDLATEIIFGGGKKAPTADIVSSSATEIVVKVPADAQKGKVEFNTASLVKVLSPADLIMVNPVITNINPTPAKTGGTITVTGTNLDLINQVTFGGSKVGTIQTGGTATQIMVTVPADAASGAVAFRTKNNETVNSSALSMVKPVIASFTPGTVQTVNTPSITITGTDLDIVKSVVFKGGFTTTVTGATATQIVVPVAPGSLTGKFKLIAKNGDEVESATDVTIVPDVPNITGTPADAYIGQKLTLTGTNMHVAVDVIFPGDKKATLFGTKSSTTLEVYVPSNVAPGTGKIKFITAKGEIYESGSLTFKATGVEAVKDLTLVFFNFDNLSRWWGDTGANENLPNVSLNGTNYFRINATLNGWTGYFWRNGKNEFPADKIGTEVAKYALKFDINVLEPITGGEFAWRLKGTSGDFFYAWNPWAATGTFSTPGWITVTIPLVEFKSGGASITNMATIDSDFGVAFNNGTSKVNVAIDNVRFALIE